MSGCANTLPSETRWAVSTPSERPPCTKPTSTLLVGSAAWVSTVSFQRGTRAHEVVLLPLNAAGTLSLRTSSIGSQLAVSVLGYVS